jgi:hypothetical protein
MPAIIAGSESLREAFTFSEQKGRQTDAEKSALLKGTDYPCRKRFICRAALTAEVSFLPPLAICSATCPVF